MKRANILVAELGVDGEDGHFFENILKAKPTGGGVM